MQKHTFRTLVNVKYRVTKIAPIATRWEATLLALLFLLDNGSIKTYVLPRWYSGNAIFDGNEISCIDNSIYFIDNLFHWHSYVRYIVCKMYCKDSSKIRDKYFLNIINKYTFCLIQSQNRSRNIYIILVAPISHYMSAWNCRAIKNRAVLWNNESLWNACVSGSRATPFLYRRNPPSNFIATEFQSAHKEQ